MTASVLQFRLQPLRHEGGADVPPELVAAYAERWTSQIVEDGHLDAKGRRVGHRVTVAAGYPHSYDRGVTTLTGPKHFAVQVWSLRDGKSFGAIPRSSYVTTYDEAVARAETAIKTARASVARKVAAGIGRQWHRAVTL